MNIERMPPHKLEFEKRIKNLAKSSKTLSQRTIRGGFWVFLFRLVRQFFSLIRLIILARVLAPHDFGLFGIALLVMGTLDTFSQTGFRQALIQKKGDIRSYLDAAWTALILRGFVLFAVLYLLAPFASVFFNAPEAMLIIRTIGLSILFQAFTNIGVIYFRKELEFNKEFMYKFPGTIADFTVSVLTVLLLRNVWALVFGLLARDIVTCVVSYLAHPYRPRLSFDLGKVKELWGFGKWILGSSILIFLLTQGDDIFVGKLLGAAALGFYQLAYRISNIPATEITHVISRVTFPAYSKLQDNISKLKEAYLRVLRVTSFLSFLVAGLIFVLAPDFTKVFLGDKWMPMVPAMQMLCIFGVVRSINATMGPVLYSIGKPKIQTKFSCIQLILMVAIIYPLTIQWGILGTSVAVVIPNILVLVLITLQLKKIINITCKELLMNVIGPVVAVFMMAFTIFLRPVFLLHGNDVFNFFLMLTFNSVIYLVIIYLWDRRKGYKIRREVYEILNYLRGKQ